MEGALVSGHRAARKFLEKVHIGNLNLLGFSGMENFLKQ
jgi:hypothetical protein